MTRRERKRLLHRVTRLAIALYHANQRDDMKELSRLASQQENLWAKFDHWNKKYQKLYKTESEVVYHTDGSATITFGRTKRIK